MKIFNNIAKGCSSVISLFFQKKDSPAKRMSSILKEDQNMLLDLLDNKFNNPYLILLISYLLAETDVKNNNISQTVSNIVADLDSFDKKLAKNQLTQNQSIDINQLADSDKLILDILMISKITTQLQCYSGYDSRHSLCIKKFKFLTIDGDNVKNIITQTINRRVYYDGYDYKKLLYNKIFFDKVYKSEIKTADPMRNSQIPPDVGSNNSDNILLQLQHSQIPPDVGSNNSDNILLLQNSQIPPDVDPNNDWMDDSDVKKYCKRMGLEDVDILPINYKSSSLLYLDNLPNVFTDSVSKLFSEYIEGRDIKYFVVNYYASNADNHDLYNGIHFAALTIFKDSDNQHMAIYHDPLGREMSENLKDLLSTHKIKYYDVRQKIQNDGVNCGRYSAMILRHHSKLLDKDRDNLLEFMQKKLYQESNLPSTSPATNFSRGEDGVNKKCGTAI